MTHAWVGHVKWCPCWVYLFAGAAPIPHEPPARCTISAARQRDQSEELRPTVMHRLSKKAQCGRRGFQSVLLLPVVAAARASFHLLLCSAFAHRFLPPAVAPRWAYSRYQLACGGHHRCCTQCRVSGATLTRHHRSSIVGGEVKLESAAANLLGSATQISCQSSFSSSLSHLQMSMLVCTTDAQPPPLPLSLRCHNASETDESCSSGVL